jgi:hypothetical protein
VDVLDDNDDDENLLEDELEEKLNLDDVEIDET